MELPTTMDHIFIGKLFQNYKECYVISFVYSVIGKYKLLQMKFDIPDIRKITMFPSLDFDNYTAGPYSTPRDNYVLFTVDESTRAVTRICSMSVMRDLYRERDPRARVWHDGAIHTMGYFHLMEKYPDGISLQTASTLPNQFMFGRIYRQSSWLINKLQETNLLDGFSIIECGPDVIPSQFSSFDDFRCFFPEIYGDLYDLLDASTKTNPDDINQWLPIVKLRYGERITDDQLEKIYKRIELLVIRFADPLSVNNWNNDLWYKILSSINEMLNNTYFRRQIDFYTSFPGYDHFKRVKINYICPQDKDIIRLQNLSLKRDGNKKLTDILEKYVGIRQYICSFPAPNRDKALMLLLHSYNYLLDFRQTVAVHAT